jgi:hypothetical protein
MIAVLGTKERKIYLLGRNQHQPAVTNYLKSIRVLKGKLPLDWYKNVLWDMSKTKLKTKMQMSLSQVRNGYMSLKCVTVTSQSDCTVATESAYKGYKIKTIW